ncbi:MAG: T9SS type A sorting domain-containing protein [Bacteroidota bacterium]
MKKKLLPVLVSLILSFTVIQTRAQQVDAIVSTFVSPVDSFFCPTQYPVSINIYNNSFDDITEVVLDWSVNGVAQSAVTWTGLITAGVEVPVEISPLFDFQSGTNYLIEVTIQSVNTQPDLDPSNDYNFENIFAYQVDVPFIYWNGCAVSCTDFSNYLSVQWYKDGVLDPNAPNAADYSPSLPGLYTLIALTYDSCDAPADTAIQVNPPTHGITPLGLTTFCDGDSVGLVFSASVQVFYTWNTGSNDDTIYASADGWYGVNGLTAQSCPIIDSIHVTVHPLPVVTITDMNDTLVSTYSGLHQWYLNGVAIGGAHDSTYVPTGSGIYYCTAIDVYGCVGTSNSINWIFPGISIPVVSASVMIYPNPAKDVINIRFESAKENLVLRIFDAVGRIVHQEEITEDKSIDISMLSEGVYQCVFTGEGKMASQKLVKTD